MRVRIFRLVLALDRCDLDLHRRGHSQCVVQRKSRAGGTWAPVLVNRQHRHLDELTSHSHFSLVSLIRLPLNEQSFPGVICHLLNIHTVAEHHLHQSQKIGTQIRPSIRPQVRHIAQTAVAHRIVGRPAPRRSARHHVTPGVALNDYRRIGPSVGYRRTRTVRIINTDMDLRTHVSYRQRNQHMTFGAVLDRQQSIVILLLCQITLNRARRDGRRLKSRANIPAQKTHRQLLPVCDIDRIRNWGRSNVLRLIVRPKTLIQLSHDELILANVRQQAHAGTVSVRRHAARSKKRNPGRRIEVVPPTQPERVIKRVIA